MSIEQFIIPWTEEYELGNDFVDSQHKRLFELVNNIGKSCLDGEDINTLSKTLDFLLQYTVQHFSDEESLQIKYDFPEYEYHKKLHEEFEVVVSEKVAEFKETGSTEDLIETVNELIITWLVNHILKEDMKIGEHIKIHNYLLNHIKT